MDRLAGQDDRTDWIKALLEPAAYPHPVARVRLRETHISWILLTGEYAYKIKKPVDLGFVDFSTLERRLHFCQEELRLNRRTAPGLYVDVVPIGLTDGGLRLGHEPAVEYAVKMRQFPDGQRLDQLLGARRVGAEDMQRAGLLLARFHESLPPWRFPLGDDVVHHAVQPARDNLAHLRTVVLSRQQRSALSEVAAWTGREAARCQERMRMRYAAGRVRECHGDLHLANFYRSRGAITPFDCLEFDPGLRCVDVASDMAFLVMDLMAAQRTDLAFVFLNSWLEATGDYAALGVLRFYLVYRAMIRAKVASVRMQQVDRTGGVGADLQKYLDVAVALTRTQEPARLVLMHGLSGSGKTWLSEGLLSRLPAVRVRSDVERKRRYGLGPLERPAEETLGVLYGPDASRHTYAVLARACEDGLAGGFHMIADATFASESRRRPFSSLARRLGADICVLYCQAEKATLRERLIHRAGTHEDASDADATVLEWQIPSFTTPAPHEHLRVVVCRTDERIHWSALCRELLDLDRPAA